MTRIGSTVFDPAIGLWRDGVQVPLQAQPARLLALLAGRNGTLVTRDEIRAALWPDTAVAYDQSINYCIRQIRIALGPDARLLETLPREGYRLRAAAVSRPARRNARERLFRWAEVAVMILSVFAVGFGAGTIARDSGVGEFVYVHLVHLDRCPYMHVLIVPHRNS